MTDLIQLRAGPIVTAPALALALLLESRGHVLTAKDGALHVTNGSALTTADRDAIAAAKNHLLAIASYEAPAHDA